MKNERVVVAYKKAGLFYTNNSPYDPHIQFPEYPFQPNDLCPDNNVYEAVREVLKYAGLDKDHFDTPYWNPLGDLVGEGETVLIKPNWVFHYHLRGEDVFSMITHPAILRPLIDYAYKAVGPNGRIWLMDAPRYDADYDSLKKICKLDEMENQLRARGVPLTIADMRALVVRIDKGVIIERIRRDNWASTGVEFDLGSKSELVNLICSLQNIFGSDYDRRVTCSFHRVINGKQRHSYRISRRALEANLVISVPKLKTHKKTGVTLNIKNMIGINTDKNYIPHYRVGSPSQGGDEFPNTHNIIKKFRRALVRYSTDIFLGKFGQIGEQAVHAFMSVLLPMNRRRLEKKYGHKLDPVDIFFRTVQGDIYRSGNWWGNDTCWRAALDINKILFYGTVSGFLSDKPVRRYLSLVDGIVGGDEEGPMAPNPRPVGVVVAGFDPISVDIIATQIMGFDPSLIRELHRGQKLNDFSLTNSDFPITVVSNSPHWNKYIRPGTDLNFRPHYAWTEYIKVSL